MNNRLLIGIGAMALAGALGLAASGVAPAIATARTDPQALKHAAGFAAKANKAMGKRQWAKAIAAAEAAVRLSPDDAGYRALLGNAYLRGGRFFAAEQTYADVMTIQPDNGRMALNLALTQIATGKWETARATLDAHAAAIPAADRGLAIALAGDPQTAIDILTVATRSPDADAKTRQNLALAFALAGRWPEARSLVSLDLTPADADRRLAEWASFARPVSASDQVAALLGITPVADPGLPTALALNAAPAATAVAQADPVDRFMPGQSPAAAVAEVPPAPVETAATQPAPAVSVPVPAAARAFVAARPVATPVRTARARPAPPARIRLIAAPGGGYKTPLSVAAAGKAPVVAARRGNWYVQLGAYGNAAMAHAGWSHMVRRYPAFADHTPAGMSARVRGASFYRLSVGGFARGDADSLCRGYRAKGGACFVRAAAGDQVASWYRGGAIQVAAR